MELEEDEAAEEHPESEVVPRYLVLHDQSEDEIVAAIVIQPHPNTTFDDRELRNLVLSSELTSLLEKISLLQSAHEYAQRDIDSLLETLRGERKALTTLRESLQKQFGASDDASAVLVEKLPSGIIAGLLYRAIPSLLAPLGPGGDAYAFFSAVLKRFVDRLREHPGAVAEGSLQEIFEKELRDKDINRKTWQDPSRDTEIIDNLIRPALSKLRAGAVDAVVESGSAAYVASLIIATPRDVDDRKRSRSRRMEEDARQAYRLKLLLRLDPGETRRATMMQWYIDVIVDQGVEVLPIERLGVLAPCARRIIERVGYDDERERRRLTFRVMAAVISEFSRLLSPPRRLSFLVETLGLTVWWRGGVPSTSFETWFLEAVDLAPSTRYEVDEEDEEDEEYDDLEHEREMSRMDRAAKPTWWGVFRKRLDRTPFDFGTKLLLLRAFYHADGSHRIQMALDLRLFDVSTHQVGRGREAPYQRAAPMWGSFRTTDDWMDDLVKIAESKVLASLS